MIELEQVRIFSEDPSGTGNTVSCSIYANDKCKIFFEQENEIIESNNIYNRSLVGYDLNVVENFIVSHGIKYKLNIEIYDNNFSLSNYKKYIALKEFSRVKVVELMALRTNHYSNVYQNVFIKDSLGNTALYGNLDCYYNYSKQIFYIDVLLETRENLWGADV